MDPVKDLMAMLKLRPLRQSKHSYYEHTTSLRTYPINASHALTNTVILQTYQLHSAPDQVGIQRWG